MRGPEKLTRYIQHESIFRCEPRVVQSLKEALVDIVGCTIAGTQTEVAAIIKEFALLQWGRGNSSVFLSDYRLQATGAALVNATMANALDIDDGHRLVKGHPGAVLFPAVLAAAQDRRVSGEEFLTALLIAYEVGIRAGILAHQLRPEYHCTGSWGAIGAAAGVARLLGLSPGQTEHALGIAEYHSTYSPMMRCIDHPSMLKDGIGWGSMTGISSAYLAGLGFTGIPSLFSLQPSAALVEELGKIYRIEHLYYKPHACCRWAQPAVEGIKHLIDHSKITPDSVEKITIHTFTESSRLSKKTPVNTEEAQYNLYFPVAAYLLYGEVGPRQVLHELKNGMIRNLMDRMETVVDAQLAAAFPEKALCRVEVRTADGNCYLSPVMQAKGDYDYPLSGEEKRAKFFWLTAPLLGEAKSTQLLELIENVERLDDINRLGEAVALAPI